MKGVFVWKVKPGHEVEFQRRWQAVSEALQSYPGAEGTLLHRGLTDPSLFAGYASWASSDSREQATGALRFDHPRLRDMAEVSEMVFGELFDEPHIAIRSKHQAPGNKGGEE